MAAKWFVLLVVLLLQGKLPAEKELQQQIRDKKPAGLWAAEWTRDGKLIAIGGDDSLLRIYNAATFSIYKIIQAPGEIKGLSWNPDGKLLAIALVNGAAFFNTEDDSIKVLPGLTVGGRAISWNASGDLLAFANGRGQVQVLRKDGSVLRAINKHNSHSYLTVHWHPTKNIILTGSDEVILFDTSGRQLQMFRHRTQPTGILTVRWHPSGNFFAVGDYGHDGEGMPTLLQFWKEDGTLLHEMKGSKGEYRNIRWSSDGARLATASDALRIWSNEGKLLHTGPSGYNLWGISWSPDDSLIVTAAYDGNIDVWNRNGQLVRQIVKH